MILESRILKISIYIISYSASSVRLLTLLNNATFDMKIISVYRAEISINTGLRDKKGRFRSSKKR